MDTVRAARATVDTPIGTSYAAYMLGVLTLVNVMNSIDRTVMWIMLEPIKQELQLTDTQLGWLSGFAFGVMYGLVGIPLGMLADRTSRKRVIGAAVAVWSSMTVFCGFANGFWSLFAARVAVGAAESGAPPASISLISDLYPERSRATAISVFMMASAVAQIITFGLGGWVASEYGWRTGFMIAGAPGLLLALLVWFTFREPRRGSADPQEALRSTATGATATPIREVIRVLAGRHMVRLLLIALTISVVASIGISTFKTSFLMRSRGLTISDAGLLIAWGFCISALLNPLVGRIADRAAERDPGGRVYVSAFVSLLGLPAILALVMIDSPIVPWIALPFFSLAYVGTTGPIFAVLQAQVGVRMRATTLSIVYALQNLVGMGLGAVLVGALSDSYAPRFGLGSLGYAFCTVAVAYGVSAVLYLYATRLLRRESVSAAVP